MSATLSMPAKPASAPELKPGIAELFWNIDVRLLTMNPERARTFLQLQEDTWQSREAKLLAWTARPKGEHPFRGELDAFDIAVIRNEIASRIAALRADNRAEPMRIAAE